MEPTWGKTEGKDTKLEEATSPAKAEKLPVLHMDGDVEVGVPQVDGCCPVPSADGMADVLGRLQAEVRSVQVRRIEVLEVDHGAHTFVRWGCYGS
jgi:hypothetical protein